MQGSSNAQKDAEAAGPCELLQLAEAQYVGFSEVWPLLVKHYSKVDSIVTGPIYNLRPVAIHKRRPRDLAAGRLASRNVVGNIGDVPSSTESSEETGRAGRPFGAPGVPDYPLPSEEAEQAPPGVAVAEDEEFSGSRFDI